MDAAEAGREAARAGVEAAAPHARPGRERHDEVIEKARAEYSGPVEVAHPGLRIEV